MNHGHVTPNPDGSKARCGGPAICSECALESIRHTQDANRKLRELGLAPTPPEAKPSALTEDERKLVEFVESIPNHDGDALALASIVRRLDEKVVYHRETKGKIADHRNALLAQLTEARALIRHLDRELCEKHGTADMDIAIVRTLLADANARIKEAEAKAFAAIAENLARGNVATENANLRVQLADANTRIAEAVMILRKDEYHALADRLEGKTK